MFPQLTRQNIGKIECIDICITGPIFLMIYVNFRHFGCRARSESGGFPTGGADSAPFYHFKILY